MSKLKGVIVNMDTVDGNKSVHLTVEQLKDLADTLNALVDTLKDDVERARKAPPPMHPGRVGYPFVYPCYPAYPHPNVTSDYRMDDSTAAGTT